ncbi:MAG: hypothetical protein IT372_14090 [Polyangiaceae bacterium]|nr:hypothetical protein [Polyangiaceae bacterium]
MRAQSLVLLALVASVTACSTTSSRPRQAPYAGPSGGAAPGYAGQAPGFAGPAFTPPAQRSAGSGPMTIIRPVNVGALQALHGRIKCPPKEVAPGTWVAFDCAAHRPVTRVIPLLLPKAKMGFTTASGPLPEYVDHRQAGTEGPIKNQQAVGACTAFSLSTAMDNAIRRMGRQDTVAPLHVWSKYAVPLMGIAGDETVNQSITLEQTWPYDPVKACKLLKDPTDSCSVAYGVQAGSAQFDPALRAEQSAADGQGRYKIEAIEQLNTKPVNTEDLAAVLAGGDDLWVSFWVDSEAWRNRSMRDGVLPEYHHNDGSGHAVVLAGYRTVAGSRQFLIHNSWGEGWGQNGYGWISEANVQRHIRSAYKVRVIDSLSPSQPQQPNASGCPAGQVRDLVLGTCAALCASGSAPAAGVCLPTIPGYSPPGSPPAQPQPNNCPQGQAPDMMTQQCLPLCPSGTPAIGGMCLPTLPR